MKTFRLLHLIATPRGPLSRTLQVSEALLDSVMRAAPGASVETVNLFSDRLPAFTGAEAAGKYQLLAGNDLTAEDKTTWVDIEREIEHFRAADGYLLSTPMWNFSVPYRLKQYLDIIIQPRYLFRYTPAGAVEGLVPGKKMVVVTSRGGDYRPGTPGATLDFQEPYLRAIFGLIGITNLTCINAQPMDAAGAVVRDEQIRLAREQAAAVGLAWGQTISN